MVQFATILLRGVIATFLGLLIAGGTITMAADRATPQRPTLVPVAPAAPTTLDVPDVTGQAYVFAKGILQDHGFAWHVSGGVQGYAANTVATQMPAPGTTVLDTGAPLIVITLQRNPSYIEKGSPENDSPYAGTTIKLPANVRAKPMTTQAPRLEPVQVPYPTTPVTPVAPTTPSAPTPTVPTQVPTATPAPRLTTPKPVTTPAPAPTQPITPATTPLVTTPTAVPSSTPRIPDFSVPGAPKEPTGSLALTDRVTALATFLETHRSPNATNLNHWLYQHAYVVAGARFGWWHGAEALEALIAVDKRAEALWGVGRQSRTTAEKALAEVKARRG